MDIIRLVTGGILILLSAFFIIFKIFMGAFYFNIFAFIIGGAGLTLGIIILLNNKENFIEQIKGGEEK